MNNLDPDVAEHPHSLVVYGGIGRAARNWECYDKIVEVLERLEDDQTLLVQSGKPVGVFPTYIEKYVTHIIAFFRRLFSDSIFCPNAKRLTDHHCSQTFIKIVLCHRINISQRARRQYLTI